MVHWGENPKTLLQGEIGAWVNEGSRGDGKSP
jgi:hypothetical protein